MNIQQEVLQELEGCGDFRKLKRLLQMFEDAPCHKAKGYVVLAAIRAASSAAVAFLEEGARPIVHQEFESTIIAEEV